MPLNVVVARSVPRDSEAIVVGVFAGGVLPRGLGWSRAALKSAGFEAKPNQTFVVPAAAGPTTVMVGLGEPGELTPAVLRNAAAAGARLASRARVVATALADLPGVDPRAAAQAVVEGVVLAGYRFSRHKADVTPPAIERLVLVGRAATSRAMEAGARRGEVIAGAVCRARDLVNEPPSFKNARDLADVAEKVALEAGLAVEVWDEERIAAERLGGLLAVNQGSQEPPRLVKLHYRPKGGRATGKVALVGKGITFDSGGLSLKSGVGMMTMKVDMAGAATVLATMSVLGALDVRAEVVGYMMCTDNLPSGTALKPGDVYTARNGKTVEVLNTDAEGRLVLGDGLSLAVEDRPDAMIDLATLTGACVVGLGHSIAGLMSNHDGWLEQVRGAAGRADEKVWPLPLPADYRKLLDSDVADLKNIGSTSHMGMSGGGAITAGLFLKEFVGDVPWVHIDMAGPADSPGENGWTSKGGTGFGVRTLVELLEGYRKPA